MSECTASLEKVQAPPHTRIKLCGLAREPEIGWVNRLLPDYVGFVFAPSRRRVDPDHARLLINLMDERVLPVGVFVDEAIAVVTATVARAGLRVVQLHGGEDSAYCAQLRTVLKPGIELWKAFRMKGPESVLEVQRSVSEGMADRVLLDAWHPEQAGGVGNVFDWTLLQTLSTPYSLAGGLHAGNVAHAIQALHPWGVDVSSGVETDGRKDEQKMTAFVTAVRLADAGRSHE